jgi:hypothetical protein
LVAIAKVEVVCQLQRLAQHIAIVRQLVAAVVLNQLDKRGKLCIATPDLVASLQAILRCEQSQHQSYRKNKQNNADKGHGGELTAGEWMTR